VKPDAENDQGGLNNLAECSAYLFGYAEIITEDDENYEW